MNKQHIAVGLSGGVDSAVSAYRLKQQGHQVTGIFMQNWETDNDDPYCTAEQDLIDAKACADHIGIGFHVVNFSQEYWQRVFQYCLDEFHLGRTPNPDIWCNKEIKFNVFLKHARALGADALATGHYAKIQTVDNELSLMKPRDLNKDQTYFLYTLNQSQLQQAIFPLADITKPEVRAIANQIGLPNSRKKDSTGICFIGERKFKDFLKEFILGKPGDICTDSGAVIGRHDGLMYYTLGQRKGLNIGGVKNAPEAPWYVIHKDIATNTLLVAQDPHHPKLMTRELICDNAHWVSDKMTLPLRCAAKTRYRQEDQPCEIHALNNNQYKVIFDEPQWAVTPGQAIVFYQKLQCLGGATIYSI